MLKSCRSLLAGALLATGLGAASLPAGAAETLRIVGNFPTTHTSSIVMEQFKAEVEQASGGELKVALFPAMQLGGAQENVDQVRAGAVFLTWISTAYLSRTVPELSALSLPFLFADRSHAFRVIDGPVGQLMSEKLAAKGFAALGYMELGPRHLTNNVRPVKSLADLKGPKIRLQPDETHLATFRALGANPTTMDIKEVYSALQQGVLDGQENPFAVTRDRNFNQVQKYVSDTAHFFDFIAVIANKKKLDALKPELRRIVTDAIGNAVATQRRLAEAEDAKALADLQGRGVQLDAVSPAFRSEMRQATAPVMEQVKAKVGAELVNSVLSQVN